MKFENTNSKLLKNQHASNHKGIMNKFYVLIFAE